MAYQEITYAAPWKGLNSRDPAIYLDPAESPALSNVWLRNKYILSAPPFSPLFAGPDGKNPVLGQTSFTDANGAVHTCSWSVRGLFQLNTGQPAQSPWSFLGGAGLQGNVPMAYRVFANVLYYTNGTPVVQSWDGISPAPIVVSGLTNSAFGGPGSSIGSLYLYELNDQICLLNVSLYNAAIVGSTPAGTVTNFSQRLWYSANGIPDQFDPSVNTSAGFNDFFEVPDIFTGAMGLGEVAYLFRTNGITEQTIAGSALQPFYYNHLWASNLGIGNVYPWSIAQYGSMGFFVATDNIYMAQPYNFTPIGGGARDAIMRDLANATLNPAAAVIPAQHQGFVYNCFEICIPLGSFTRIYRYSLEDQNWMQHDLANLLVTANPSLCWR
jgi:hypothetical protein